MQEAIRTRSKKTLEPLLEGLDESRWRRRIRTFRELFPPPEDLLQPSPQGSHHSTEEMENNNDRRTLVDYTNVDGSSSMTRRRMLQDAKNGSGWKMSVDVRMHLREQVRGMSRRHLAGEQCQFALYMEEGTDFDDVESVLCVPGGHFQRNRNGAVVNIRRFDLTSLAKYWMAFSHANIQSCSHVSDITVNRALILYCVLRNMSINIGQVIANEIQVCANTMNNKAPLGHPSLITHLCEIAGVNISTPPFERPWKAIDEAYYRQYCRGEEAAQPVPPRRPRRGRGPVQSQASAETHEVEPLQMTDMYMSLIDAQMHSIHRGQVATVEMIIGMYDTPPAHRWTMDEFHDVVAWPEENA
ncbi:hypothetical protein LR48_Vigan17s000200 [Vigna angularis]|uniref:Putative plant transposon protein domain-containing protein n=1 Tax=Phaseolus angularis TaxID=3914 RepID=A0A0L9T3G8_PHAAN|nr:hypothetical protein LR48_Vigan17s000200 [Vigna angularis]